MKAVAVAQPNNHRIRRIKQSGREYRLGFIGLLASIVLVISFSRGLVPLLTRNAALSSVSYDVSALLGVLLSVTGIIIALDSRGRVVGTTVTKLLLANLFGHFLWFIPVVFFTRDPIYLLSPMYLAVFPFAIYGLARIPNRVLFIIFGLATLLVATTVLWDFVDINLSIGAGQAVAYERQLLLRPGIFEGFGRTSDVLMPVGIFGERPHDAASFLAILGIFWLSLTITERTGRVMTTLFATVAFLGLAATQVASDNIAYLVGVVILLWQAGGVIRLKPILIGMFILLLVSVGAYELLSKVVQNPTELIFYWTWRVTDRSQVREDMVTLGITYSVGDLAALVAGHSGSLKISPIGDTTEIGFVKLLVEYGIFHFTLFLLFLTLPLIRFMKVARETKREILPYVLAETVGVISLWHYGTVFRTTNVFIFYAMYAQALLAARSHAVPLRGKLTL